MYNHFSTKRIVRFPIVLLLLSSLLIILAACGGATTNTPTASQTSVVASSQILTFPNVGTRDIGVLDPAQGPDANSALAVGMIYTGLVKFDKNLNVVPDQATWVISLDHQVYTFTLKQVITVSNESPGTSQSHKYILTN